MTRRQRGRHVTQRADEDVLAVTGGEPLRNGSREQDDGAGKDRRNDAGHVQLQRQIGGLPLIDLVTDLTLGVVDGDPTLAALDEDHEGRHQNDQRHDDQRRHRVHVAVADQRAHAANGAGQTGHDAGEDDQRDAVAQTPFSDLFAQPHQEHRAGDQRNDRHEAEHEAGVGDQVTLRLQSHRDAQCLERGQCQREPPGVLGDDPPTGLAFLLDLLERRYNDRQQLHDDRCRNVRHDPQRKHREPAERATREEVEQAEDAALLAAEEFRHRVRVDSGHRDVGADAEHHKRQQQKHKTALQVAVLVGLTSLH